MYSIPRRWSVSCWKMRASNPSATRSSGFPWTSSPRHRIRCDAARRMVRPRDRQAALLLGDLPLGVEQLRVRHEPGTVLAVVEHEQLQRDPDLRGRPAPRRAPRTSSRSCPWRAGAAHDRTTRRALPAHGAPGPPGCGSVAACGSSSDVRFGFDALHHARGGEGSHGGPERGEAAGLEREQAYRPAPERGQQGGDRFLLLDRRFELGGPDDPEHRGARPGIRPPHGVRARAPGTDRDCRARAPAPRDPTGASSARSPDRPGASSSPPPSRSPARVRARQAPGAWPRGRHRAPRRGPGHRRRGPARPRARRSRSRPSLSAAAGARRERPAPRPRRPTHSSTRSAPPRRIPKDDAPHAPQRPGASQTTHRTAPDEARSMPPHAAHAAGAPQARQTCATP